MNPGDGCSADCAIERCGNNVVDPGEACDDGNPVETDACLSSCRLARCGDGVLYIGVEDCDDGNQLDTDACLSTCTVARCGDGQVWAGGKPVMTATTSTQTPA